MLCTEAILFHFVKIYISKELEHIVKFKVYAYVVIKISGVYIYNVRIFRTKILFLKVWFSSCKIWDTASVCGRNPIVFGSFYIDATIHCLCLSWDMQKAWHLYYMRWHENRYMLLPVSTNHINVDSVIHTISKVKQRHSDIQCSIFVKPDRNFNVQYK